MNKWLFPPTFHEIIFQHDHRVIDSSLRVLLIEFYRYMSFAIDTVRYMELTEKLQEDLVEVKKNRQDKKRKNRKRRYGQLLHNEYSEQGCLKVAMQCTLLLIGIYMYIYCMYGTGGWSISGYGASNSIIVSSRKGPHTNHNAATQVASFVSPF